jgi:hypothetical protein
MGMKGSVLHVSIFRLPSFGILLHSAPWLESSAFSNPAPSKRLVREALADLRMTPGQLRSLPANARAKVDLARRLRRETTMSLKWLAQKLGISSWKYLSNLLARAAPNPAQPELGI